MIKIYDEVKTWDMNSFSRETINKHTLRHFGYSDWWIMTPPRLRWLCTEKKIPE